MKKKIAYLALSLGLFASVLSAPVLGYALADSNSGTDNTATTNAANTDEKAKRDARVESYKKTLKETLTAAVKTRITERCVASQALVKVRSTNNSNAGAARTTSYNAIATKLESLSTAAAAKGAPVTTLNANITELKVKIVAFTTADTTYKDALADLSALDCKTDPTAFKAALETARSDQASVFAASKAIRAYLVDTVKPTLSAIKTALNSTAN